MEIEETKDGEVVILALEGSLNTQTSPKLEQKLLKLLQEKARLVVIDFKGVDYLSSAALRVLLMITRRLVRAQGRLVLCKMSDDLRKVFSISGFDRDFTILQTRGEAVALAAKAPAPTAKSETKPPKAPKAAPPSPEPEAKAKTPPSKAASAPSWPSAAAPASAAPTPRPEEPQVTAPSVDPVLTPAPPRSSPLSVAVASVLAQGESERPAWSSWPAGPSGPAVSFLAAKIAAALAERL